MTQYYLTFWRFADKPCPVSENIPEHRVLGIQFMVCHLVCWNTCAPKYAFPAVVKEGAGNDTVQSVGGIALPSGMQDRKDSSHNGVVTLCGIIYGDGDIEKRCNPVSRRCDQASNIAFELAAGESVRGKA